MRYKVICLTAILLPFLTNLAQAQTYAKNGMVVSAQQIASDIGLEILKKGGNAIDASIATAFALQVVHPFAGNIGGGGFIVFMNASGNVTTIDFREKAPLKAKSDMFLDEKGDLIENENHFTLKAVGVPGTVAGLWLAHQKYGKLPWQELVQPAIDVAMNGFEMTWYLHMDAQYYSKSGFEFMQTYFNDENGKRIQFGETWRQPSLAKTLEYIRDNGKDGFYAGPVAKEIEDYMKSNGGLISRKDLKKYEAIERSPIRGNYRGYDIYAMPPPSSGGITLIQMLNILENTDMDSIPFNSTSYVHLLAETMRRGFADRAEFLGDPDFNPDMPVDRLTSKAHAKKRFNTIDWKKASPSDSSKFGHPYDGQNTTHLSVIDKEGNAVSLTYTLEYGYGCRMGSKKLGFVFNNEMGDFNPVPGLTNSKGLIGTNPNVIEPEKRMLSSMTPTIVAKEGRPYLIIGSPGGRSIINTVFQTIIGVIDYEMRVDEAIEAMKIHHAWLPDRIFYEEHLLSPDTRKNLEQMGHSLQSYERLGALMGITVDPKTGVYFGASDSSRDDGKASGY